MMGICRLCRQLVSGDVNMELGERTEREMVGLADSATQHLAAYHPQVLAEMHRVLHMAAHYMALLTFELDSELAATRDAFRQAVGAAIDGVAVVGGQLPNIPTALGQGAPQ